MDHISKDLERLNQERRIVHLSNIEPMPDRRPSRITMVGGPDETVETKEQKLEHLRHSLGLSSLEHTFETFKRVKGTETSFSAFKAMAEGKAKPMLLCYGSVGNGKTHLCEALSIELCKKGIRCPVTIWPDTMRMFKGAMHRGDLDSPSYDDLFEQFRRRERLILDDVGMGSTGSEWEWGELEDIINYRYRERLFTVLVTNKDLDELPVRVTSRFFDPEIGVVCLNSSVDFRRIKSA